MRHRAPHGGEVIRDPIPQDNEAAAPPCEPLVQDEVSGLWSTGWSDDEARGEFETAQFAIAVATRARR